MTARANTKNLLEQWESGTWATPLNALFRRQLTFPFLLLNQPIKVQTHGWRHGKLLFFGLSNNGWAMARSFENFARLYRIKQVKAVHMMLLPSQKPSSSYSLLKFVLRHQSVTSFLSQWCTPSKEKSWIHPWCLLHGLSSRKCSVA